MIARDACAPAEYDAYSLLRNPGRNEVETFVPTNTELAQYSGSYGHFGHLACKAYHEYVRIHKVLVGTRGAEKLENIAGQLEQESLPVLLDAAGWAFAESALADTRPFQDRMNKIDRAETAWIDALRAHDSLVGSELEDSLLDDDTPYRLALNIAFAPLLRGIVSKNVTKKAMKQTFKDVLNIAELVSVQTHLSFKEGRGLECCQLSGLTHECNALLAMLYLTDPRYVPLPSTARADSGYYHSTQTHDISVVNQHWGTIKKIIPVEVKKAPSLADRKRYKAVMLSKRDLVYEPHFTAHSTLSAFAAVYSGENSDFQQQVVDRVTEKVKLRLIEYQRRPRAEMPYRHSRTKFNEPTAAQKKGVGAKSAA